MELKAIIWKELKDLSRDRKTLFTAVFLPAFMLPLMAQLLILAMKSVPTTIVVVNMDKGAEVPSFLFQPVPFAGAGAQKVNLGDQLVNLINVTVHKINPLAKVVVLKNLKEVKNYDILVIIPKDFSEKLLVLDPRSFNVTEVAVYYKASSASMGLGANTIYQAIVQLFKAFSTEVAKERAQVLLACCNVTEVSPQAVISPLVVKTQYVSVTGQRISRAELSKLMSSKLLMFSIFYVTVPVLAFVSDSVAGEKERKTLETLLASPIKRRNIVLGKFVATIVLGLIAAVADVVGLIAYIQILNSQISSIASVVHTKGVNVISLTLDPRIIALHGVVMFLVVASTAAMLMPIASLTDSVRSAQSVGGIVQMIPLLVILYAMYADVYTLPMPWKAFVFAIPHTYAVVAIDQALKGSVLGVVESLAVMVIITAALLWITTKIFESELLVTSAFAFGRARKKA